MSTSYYRFQLVLIVYTMRLSDDKHKEGTEIESFKPALKCKTCVPLVYEVTWICCKQSLKPMAEIYGPGQGTGQNTDVQVSCSSIIWNWRLNHNRKIWTHDLIVLEISFADAWKNILLLRKKITVPKVRKHVATATEDIERSNRASAKGHFLVIQVQDDLLVIGNHVWKFMSFSVWGLIHTWHRVTRIKVQ